MVDLLNVMEDGQAGKIELSVHQNTEIVPGDDKLDQQVEMVDAVIQHRPSRPRNYSFKHKKVDSLDAVEGDGCTYVIPAAIGSTYWAILKTCYEHANQPVMADDLLKSVDDLMRDRDEETWNKYCNKSETTVYRKGEKRRLKQNIKTWQERITNNAKTLTRLGGNSQYGKRLFEVGHVLRFRYNPQMKPYFILHTSLDCLTDKQKAKAGVHPENKT